MNVNLPTTFLDRLLARTGRMYIPVVLLLITLLSYPVAIFAGLPVYINAELKPAQAIAMGQFVLGALTISNLTLVLGQTLWVRTASRRLGQWQTGIPLTSGDDAERRSWFQINQLPVAVALQSAFNYAMLVIAPLMAYAAGPAGLNRDQQIYTFFGGSVIALSSIALFVMLADQAMQPARRVLLPMKFQSQLFGAWERGLVLLLKSLFIITSLIGISALLVAPIGYHQTVRVLYTEVGSLQVLRDLQIQSILVSAMVVLFGALLGWLLIRGITNPVRALINVFARVEEGDLRQRAPVLSGDELGQLVIYFNRMLSRLEELQGNLERQVAERTAQLEAVNEVGRVASSILDPNELVSRVVHLIADRFDYYYAAIFLISPDGQWAELRDATGEAGQVLKAQRHRLPIGGRSMVSAAIQTRQARIALDVGQEAVRFNNPLLPDTRSEIALPLMVGDTVLGALDVQSTREAAFGEADIRTLQGMANQVAIALENARLFQETQASLAELRAIQRQYLADAWTRVASKAGDSLEYLAEQGGAGQEGVNQVEIPLALREQVIGQIRIDSEDELGPEERSWVEAIATQAALALENARLLEESQAQAARDRLLSEITRRIWQTPTIPGILQTTIRELGRALNVAEATIRIGTPPAQTGQERA